MKKYKVLLVSIEAADQPRLTQAQAKINQWITTGLLVKYDIHTTATHVVFNICLLKKQGE